MTHRLPCPPEPPEAEQQMQSSWLPQPLANSFNPISLRRVCWEGGFSPSPSQLPRRIPLRRQEFNVPADHNHCGMSQVQEHKGRLLKPRKGLESCPSP